VNGSGGVDHTTDGCDERASFSREGARSVEVRGWKKKRLGDEDAGSEAAERPESDTKRGCSETREGTRTFGEESLRGGVKGDGAEGRGVND